MHRLRSHTTMPCQPTAPLRQRYRIVALMLMATFTGVALPAEAQEAPALSGGLPLQLATLADGSSPTGNAPPASNAAPADEMATMVATLQKQIIAQQALLQVLQARLAAGSVPLPGGSGATSTAAAAPPVPTAGAPSAKTAFPSALTPPVTEPAVTAANAGQVPPSQNAKVASVSEEGAIQNRERGAPSAVSTDEHESPQETTQGAETVSARSPDAEAPGPSSTGADITLSTDVQRQAYASGASVWREIKSSIASQHALGIDLDERYVMAGLQDMALNHPLKISADEMDRAMWALNTDYIRRANEARQHQEAEGRTYRIAFAKQKGAYSDAGAWYRIDDRGQGRHLRTTDMAVLQVTGTLPDGTVFDDSGQQGRTRTVKVGSLLPSVAIGLQKVALGGRLTVVVPPQKGYGDAGLPPSIPGGATLIFDITVKSISRGD